MATRSIGAAHVPREATSVPVAASVAGRRCCPLPWSAARSFPVAVWHQCCAICAQLLRRHAKYHSAVASLPSHWCSSCTNQLTVCIGGLCFTRRSSSATCPLRSRGALGSYAAIRIRATTRLAVSLDVFSCHGLAGVAGAFLADVFTTQLANPAGGDGWLAAPSPEGRTARGGARRSRERRGRPVPGAGRTGPRVSGGVEPP